jgi:hypothetical protein
MGCGSPEPAGEEPRPTVKAPSERVIEDLSETELLKVCTAGIAFRGALSPANVSAKLQGEDIVRGKYIRAADGKSFRYDCKASGEILRFRMIDELGLNTGAGSWSGSGSTTYFELVEKGVLITESYGPGDSISELIEIP